MNRLNSTNKKPLIEVDGVYKNFDNGNIEVLQDVSLKVSEGEIVTLWGASGSGKTTLLYLIGGLDIPTYGHVTVAGRNPASDRDRLYLRRNKVGFVFQLHNLIPDLTLRENCMVTCVANRGDHNVYRQRYEELVGELGLENLGNRRIQELSGGERQRVALCRALMHRPSIILADEPTGSLDEKNGEHVFNLLKNLARKEGTTVVMATHERRFSQSCDRIIHVRDGKVSEIGI